MKRASEKETGDNIKVQRTDSPENTPKEAVKMLRAWFMDTSDEDQRLPHQRDPPKSVDLDYMKEHGVLYWKIDADNYKEEGLLDKIRKERNYTYEDEIAIKKGVLPNYEDKIKMFFKEHLHDDEEIRFCVDGSGYFDFRDKNDEWIRIEFTKGDLIVLPAGIYHRFTLDTKDYIKAKRYFVGEPVWTPINRPADENTARKGYVKSLSEGSFAA